MTCFPHVMRRCCGTHANIRYTGNSGSPLGNNSSGTGNTSWTRARQPHLKNSAMVRHLLVRWAAGKRLTKSPYPKQAFKTRSPPGTRWDIQVQTGYTGRRVVSPTRGSNCWGSSERILRFHMGKLNFSQKKGLLRMVVRWEIAT